MRRESDNILICAITTTINDFKYAHIQFSDLYFKTDFIIPGFEYKSHFQCTQVNLEMFLFIIFSAFDGEYLNLVWYRKTRSHEISNMQYVLY